MHASNSPASNPGACHLLLFLRYPQVGQTKTRLIPALGAAGAADLQRRMAEYLVRRLRHPNWTLQIHYSNASLSEMQALLGHDLTYCRQKGMDLGDRIWHGFQQTFTKARRSSTRTRAIAIGADCPDLSYQHIQNAFNKLREKDVVLGPASDGGYYLIGLKQSPSSFYESAVIRNLFQGIDWSTPYVFEQTMQKIQRLALTSAQLEMLSDIDRPEDLAIWERLQAVAQQVC